MTPETKAAVCVAARDALKRIDPDNQMDVNEKALDHGTFEYFLHPYGWVSDTTHAGAVRKMAARVIDWRQERGFPVSAELRRTANPPPPPA